MKITRAYLGFAAVLIAAHLCTVNAVSGCDIKFFEFDSENWGNASAGFLMGMQTEDINPAQCTDCWRFAHNMQMVNYGINYVILKKDKWIDQNKVSQLDVTQTLAALLDIYTIFMSFMIPIDSIF